MRKLEFQPTILIFVVFALLFALTACGGRDDEEPKSEPAAAAESNVEAAASTGDPVAGEKVYQGTCVACHGPDAKGVENLGKSLHPSYSDFVSTRTDEELVEYIKVGRLPDDPLNTTGVAMPAKGGNPALTEEDMYNVVAYMRTLDE